MPSEAPASCPITVAMAAPATPMAGMPNHPKIKMGSSTMLMMAPVPCVNIVSVVRPVEASSFSNAICTNRPMEITLQMRKYAVPPSTISATPVCI